MLICIDIETTGLDPEVDEILEMAILDENGKILFNLDRKNSTQVE